jgi:hypothetical protein
MAVHRIAQGLTNRSERGGWAVHEIDEGAFADLRLGRRLRTLLEQLSEGPGQSLPLVCQDWANAKAAHRFLSNEHVDEDEILAGHINATRARLATVRDAPVLVLHDTTEFSWRRKSIEPIGLAWHNELRPGHRGSSAIPQSLRHPHAFELGCDR